MASDAASARAALEKAFEEKQVVACVGVGGVGKTTLAAALALEAARRGRRVLCLTIDPARRLAESLGLESIDADETRVSKEWLRARGVEIAGEMTVMMLDSGRTFDELVDRHAPTRETADAIKRHRIYRHLSRNVAGTRSYMAMEKVQEVAREGRYDWIVLDTPPGERALDFFDAPTRMREILDSPATRALGRVARVTGKTARVGLLQSGFQGLLRTMGRVTGTSFLEELGGLLSLLGELFGGFGERAERVSRAMRGPDHGYVLVTAPHALTLRQADELADELAERGIELDAIAVNRVTPHPGPLPTREELLASEFFRSHGLGVADATSVLEAASHEAREAVLERRRIEEVFGGDARKRAPPRVEVPVLAGDLKDPALLLEIARALLGAPR